MTPLSIGVLAVSMSVDAFIASVGKGAQAKRPNFGNAIRTGAIFGVIEAITPLIGWAAGVAASQYVAAVDHWIAFALLAGVGTHIILQAQGADEGAVRTYPVRVRNGRIQISAELMARRAA